MNWSGHVVSGLVGAVLGVVAIRTLESGPPSLPASDPALVRILEGIDAQLARLASDPTREGRRADVASADAPISTAAPEVIRKPDGETGTDGASVRGIVNDIVADLTAVRNALHELRNSTDAPSMSIHQRLERAGAEKWEEIDRFTKGFADQGAWSYRAQRDLVLMTEAEVVERFGKPTICGVQWWEWEHPVNTTPSGCARVLEIQFIEGRVNSLKAHDE